MLADLQVTLHAKMATPDLQWYPRSPNVEDIPWFLWLEKRLLPLVSTLLLINKNAQVAFAEKSQKNKQIEETKLLIRNSNQTKVSRVPLFLGNCHVFAWRVT